MRLFLPKAMEDRPIEKRGYTVCSRRCSLAAAVSAIKFDTCDAPNGPALRECSPEAVRCFDKAFTSVTASDERTHWVNATLGGAGVVLGGILMVGVFLSFRRSSGRRGAARNSRAPAVLEVQMESHGGSNESTRSECFMSK